MRRKNNFKKEGKEGRGREGEGTKKNGKGNLEKENRENAESNAHFCTWTPIGMRELPS